MKCTSSLFVAVLLLVVLQWCGSPVIAQDVLTPITLDLKSFTDGVTGQKMPWLITFREDASNEDTDIVALSQELDGYARVGVVAGKDAKDLLKHLKLTKETAPVWRLYPFNDRTKHQDFTKLEDAKAALMASLPDNLVTVGKTSMEIQQAIISSVNTATIPVILFSESPAIPTMLQKLAMWLPQYTFLAVGAPSAGLQKEFNVDKLPQLQVMLVVPDEATQQASVRAFPYDRTKFGGLKFKNAVRFLVQAEYELRKTNMWPKSPEKTEPERSANYDAPLSELFEINANSSDVCPPSKLGLCVVALLDGSPDNNAKEDQLEILRKTQSLPSNKGRVLHFMWVDIRCHPSFGQVFDIRAESAPTIIAVAPKKNRYAHMRTTFDSDKIASFIGGVLSGKESLAPLSAFPTVSADDDCVKLYESLSVPPPQEDEFDLSDIMGEDVGVVDDNNRAAKAAAAEEARIAAEKAADDAERAAKERIAREEIERLNKKNKKKTKKAKAKKDEL